MTTPNYTAPDTILKLTCPLLNEAGEPLSEDPEVYEFVSAAEAREQIGALMEAGVQVYNINGGFRVHFEDEGTFTDYIDARCIDQEWRHQ